MRHHVAYNYVVRQMADLIPLQYAADLGDTDAVSQLGARPNLLPEHYRSRIELAVSPLTTEQRVAFACECAVRVQSFWLDFNARDSRPANAITAAQDWLHGKRCADFAALSTAASDAGVTALNSYEEIEGYTTTINDASPAGRAAYSAQWAAVSAHSCTDILCSDECYACAYAAKAAVWATHESDAEYDWQAKRLCDYLLGRA